jgi:hypothetical protein
MTGKKVALRTKQRLREFFDKQQYTDIDILRRFLRTRQQHIIFTYCMNVLRHIRRSKLYVY